MRNTVLVLLLASAAFADEAADLFYRAFWLEQAAGKSAEAEELYRKVAEAYPKAPEAPQALLGLIRIRAGRGEEVKEFVAILERDYPAAGEEIAEARRRLKAERRPTPADAMGLGGLVEALAKAEPNSTVLGQIADMGAAAHEMLRSCLQSTDAGKVANATRILLMQREADSYALLAATLGDRATPLRNAILNTLALSPPVFPASLVEPVARLYEGAAPRTREAVVRVLRILPAQRGLGKAANLAYPVLARALSDEDGSVRAAAVVIFPWTSIEKAIPSDVPESYVEALIARVEAGEFPQVLPNLLPFLGRSSLSSRIAALLVSAPQFPVPQMPDEQGWLALADAALERYRSQRDVGSVGACCRASDAALALTLTRALVWQDPRLAASATSGSRASGTRNTLPPELLRMALRAALGAEGPGRQVGTNILQWYPPQPTDIDETLAEMEASPGAGLPFWPKEPFLRAIGAEKAARLASFVRDPRQARYLLEMDGGLFGAQPSDARRWREALLPRYLPESNSTQGVSLLTGFLAADPALAPAVALRLLAGEEPEWDWAEGGGLCTTGPTLWRHPEVQRILAQEPLRSQLRDCSYACDSRLAIALTAVDLARGTEGDRGLAALREAMRGARREQARSFAVEALVSRGDPASLAVVAELLDSTDSPAELCSVAIQYCAEFGRREFAPRIAAYLRRHPSPSGWRWLAKLDGETCATTALELLESPTREVRQQALYALGNVEDVRRVEVFRAVLTGRREGDLAWVLATVGDQYLVELGAEVLAHLRNPDGEIRDRAGQTIEKLKFYAEAKKVFEPTSR